MKIAGCVEYDGSQFCGWQIQEGHPTVQSALENALSNVADHPVRVHCAGRTDTGVHACAQIVHFETESIRSEHSWVMGVNSKLPRGVVLIWTCEVDDSFHARFSALSRKYRYILLNRRVAPGYLSKRVSWYPRKLDFSRMNAAASTLIGTHDFSAFRSARCKNKVPVKTVKAIEVGRCGEWIWIDVEASGFLHHMVRNFVGVLLAIGCGDKEVAWAKEVLERKDRTLAGITAPADGLYFTSVDYPKQYKLPAIPAVCKYW